MLLRVRQLTARPLLLISCLHTSLPSYTVVKKFNLADIGEGITECEVIKWSVKKTSSVQAFDPLCEVQSDKASVEITSPFEGVVKEILVQEGEIAKVGEGLCLIEVEEEEAVQQLDEAAENLPSHSEQGAQENKERVVHPPEEPKPKRRPHPLDPAHAQDNSSTSGITSDSVLATPSVRHFARQKGVDLASLAPGSGRGGRVEKKDVEQALLSRESRTTSVEQSHAGFSLPREDVVVELGRTRYGMWKAMTKSLEIPHFGYSTTLDITSIHNLLPTLNSHIPPHYLPQIPASKPQLMVNPSALYPAPSHPAVPESSQYTRLTYLPILLKTLSRAMIEWPLFRSSITNSPSQISPSSSPSPSSKPTLTVRPHADISIALSTPTGLYTPTLVRTDTHSIYSLASQLRHLSHLGRQTPCGLGPAEMPKRGGTLTVSNVGAIGAGDYAMPVLVPGGGVAIVAVGRAKWVRDEERAGERRLKVGVSWSADHRVVEGAELAAFVECWRAWVECPERFIGESV